MTTSPHTDSDPQESGKGQERLQPTSPTFVSHVERVYELLAERAETEEMDGESKLIFRGKITEVFAEAKISNSYYSRVFKVLELLGCIVPIRRGARGVESILHLVEAPDSKTVAGLHNRVLTLQGATDTTVIESRIEAIEHRLGGLDIVKALENFEKRIKKLEKRGKDGKAA